MNVYKNTFINVLITAFKELNQVDILYG